MPRLVDIQLFQQLVADVSSIKFSLEELKRDHRALGTVVASLREVLKQEMDQKVRDSISALLSGVNEQLRERDRKMSESITGSIKRSLQNHITLVSYEEQPEDSFPPE